MICNNCLEIGETEVEMALETITTDSFDPTVSTGHGQYEEKAWLCPKCNSIQDYLPDDED